MLSIPTLADGSFNLAAMDPNTPYRITREDDLERFRDGLGPWDVIYAIVGMNGMGKSSILKALLGLAISNTSIPIGMGTNTTPFPVVAYICTVMNKDVPTRIYLMDTPGFGAAGAIEQDQETEFFFNNPAGLINLIKPCVGSVFYVERDSAPSDDSVRLYTVLAQAAFEADINIRVIYNTIGITPIDEISGQASLIKRFSEGVAPPNSQVKIVPNFDQTKVVRCRAITGDTTEGRGKDVTALREMWTEEIKPANIMRAGQSIFVQHRTAMHPGSVIERPLRMKIASLCGTAGFGSVGYLTYLPGAAWWGTAPLFTIQGVTAVLALPVVITGAATGGMVYVGYKQAPRLYRWGSWVRSRGN